MGSGKSGLYHNTKGAKNETKSKSDVSQFSENVKTISSKYRIGPSGYFGEKGKNHRIIRSNTPVQTSADFYKKISKGGIEFPLPNRKGVQAVFSDGTRIVYRMKTSTPNSPAVEISVSIYSPVKNQKIHFIKER